MELPVVAALPALARALAERGRAVLQAPPGAGKTTLVPPALLGEPWLAGRKIVMLEPRRVAARAAARFMARGMNEPVGETVGYRVRLDTRAGPRTRIEVVTEGVLTRMLQDDPALDSAGIVIFDEFHERSIHADLGLALALQGADVLRPDLRILVMSATLDGARVAGLLGGAPVITSEGRVHPVRVQYLGPGASRPLEANVVAAIGSALGDTDGDVLVFLPGAGEIRRVAARLEDQRFPEDIRIAQLHGSLPPADQDRALDPAPGGARKVVLATSIAQTSLTIEGVRVVIDAGLSRVPRFSPRSGMTRLETVRVSRASADQRAGRAGRVAPGVCYRLWSEGEHASLLPHDTPEILEADLVPLALTLAAAGVTDAAHLAWLDPPPSAPYEGARALLHSLDALDGDGRITARGREMSRLAVHPRLAHMLIDGAESGAGSLAADIAALLGERDILQWKDGPPPADLRLRLDQLRGERREFTAVDVAALARVRAEAGEIRRAMNVRASDVDIDEAGGILALAYPDRIARRRPGAAPRYLLSHGTGATLDRGDALAREEYLVIAETDGARPEARILIAAPISREAIERRLAAAIVRDDVVAWDSASGAVVARRRRRLGAILLDDGELRDADSERIRAAVIEGLRGEGLGGFPWSDAARRLRERVAFLRLRDAAWPDLSDAELARTLHEWLGPRLDGVRRRSDIARLDLASALLSLVPWELRGRLDALAPTHVVVPTGSRIPVDYADPRAPALAVRLQELFGLADTPSVAEGTVPLTLHLLSPAGRPVQVTRDLAGFWKSSYFEVRKDLRGRYPKHAWPENPLEAEPTRRARRRGE
ncbi:MAG TPA: ATP-dependent helicase HrpB [Gemmatimonadales bacterium]